MILVDTNVLLRVILDDDVKQSQQAAAFIDRAKVKDRDLVVPQVVLAEVAWVLEDKGWEREDVAGALREVCTDERLTVRESETFIAATRIYAKHNVSMVDAYQAALAAEGGWLGIASFDRDFEKLGVKRIDPST